MAFIQGNSHQNGAASSATCAVPLSGPVGNGNGLCVSVSFASAGTGVADNITVTDDKNNVYTPVDAGFNSNANYSQYTFYALNLTNAPQTVTATDNTSARQFITTIVDEFSNLSALDGHSLQAQANPGTGTDAVSSGTYTTIQNGDLIWGVAVSFTGAGLSLGSGFTVGGTNNVANSFFSEYRIQSAAGAGTAATFTDGAGTDQTVAGSMAFKSASSATLPFGNTMQTRMM